MNGLETAVINAIGTGNLSLEDLALAVGKGRRVTVVQIDDDFRDLMWTMVDNGTVDLDWNLDFYVPGKGQRLDGKSKKQLE